MSRDALPYLPPAYAWHRTTGWCRAHGGFLAVSWASRWWHARPRTARKAGP